mmetsp:Transcript_115967/g.249160  ORF Transcript_115967/g.249160 Transcript_115967/m.249160 type:complete len:163 (+) Transcript_115967:38-526(+)
MSDEVFETIDTGASLTKPEAIGSLRIGHMLCIDNRPCKVIDMSTAKTGKHGSAKANIRAQDIFTQKMKEFIGPTSHNVDTPFVVNTEFLVIDIDQENDLISCTDLEGTLREEGLPLPSKNEDLLKKLVKRWEEIQEKEEEKEIIVMATSAMGETHVTAFKEK